MVALINRTSFSPDDKTRFYYYSIFLLLGMPTMLAYGLYNLLNANYILLTFISLSATGLISGWLYLINFENGKIVYRINSFLFSLLILYMLFVGGEGGSKILWMYTYPLILFFLFGKYEGLFWSVAVISISLILFWNPFNFSNAYSYSDDFIIRFLTTYIMVSTITYWFEHFRYKYRIEAENKTKILKQEILERKRAEKNLQTAKDNLEVKVNARTADLYMVKNEAESAN